MNIQAIKTPMLQGNEVKLPFRERCSGQSEKNAALPKINLKINLTTWLLVWCIYFSTQPFKGQPHKMVKHTQTIRRQFADELFELV